MSHPALNLNARDFDAYAPEKATSNAYSRPRLEVKQRALTWARPVVLRLAELGIAVDVHGSDEHPSLRNRKRVDCQWVFFWRDQAARDELDRLLDRGRSIAAEIDDPSPYQRHAFLALRIDADAVEVCFAVHPEAQVDVENLRARLAPAADGGAGVGAAELMAALGALPEQFAIGVSHADRIAASAVTPEALGALVERAAAGQVPLWIGWSVKRGTAIEHAALLDEVVQERPPTLDEQLEDAIIALAPIYHLIAWSRGNDWIALDRRIESAEQERARAHAEAAAQTARWQAEQAEARRRSAEQARARSAGNEPEAHRHLTPPPPRRGRADLKPVHEGGTSQRPAPPATIPPARKPSLESLFAAKPTAPAIAPAIAPAAPSPSPPPPPPPSPPSPRTSAEGSGERATTPSVLEKGVKVRVLSGPFTDKIGVVGELDGRGGARVHLGLLSTRIEVADLEPVAEGRDRPALQSSHRRHLASAPRKAR